MKLQALLTARWTKPIGFMLAMILFAVIAPAEPVDPWKLLSPKKVLQIVSALMAVQILAEFSIQVWGDRAGSLLAGFLGGLISSTALTAGTAKHSRDSDSRQVSVLSLRLVSGSLAMLVEALALAIFSSKRIEPSVLLIFLGPFAMTLFFLYRLSNRVGREESVALQGGKQKAPQFEVLPILKLTAFIVGVLALSKFLQDLVGDSGLLALTFFVSLFEIHGSIIANCQLQESGSISASLLGTLLAISILSSYVSKFFLVSFVGSIELRRDSTIWMSGVLTALAVSWVLFKFVIRV